MADDDLVMAVKRIHARWWWLFGTGYALLRRPALRFLGLALVRIASRAIEAEMSVWRWHRAGGWG